MNYDIVNAWAFDIFDQLPTMLYRIFDVWRMKNGEFNVCSHYESCAWINFIKWNVILTKTSESKWIETKWNKTNSFSAGSATGYSLKFSIFCAALFILPLCCTVCGITASKLGNLMCDRYISTGWKVHLNGENIWSMGKYIWFHENTQRYSKPYYMNIVHVFEHKM